MAIYYHGSAKLFDTFSLSHALEGDGKAKFGFGVYVAGTYESAAHYAFNKKRPQIKDYYVYTVEIPDCTEENCLTLQKRVPVLSGDTPDTLYARIAPHEHEALVEGVCLLAESVGS